jgi:hypothetical protein
VNASQEAPTVGRRDWGPIEVSVYCDACGTGTQHRWADFDAEQIECQVCRGLRAIEHVEGDPAL